MNRNLIFLFVLLSFNLAACSASAMEITTSDFKSLSAETKYSDFIETYGKPDKEVKSSAVPLISDFYTLYYSNNYKADKSIHRTYLFYELDNKYVLGLEFDIDKDKLVNKLLIRTDLTIDDFKRLSPGTGKNEVFDAVGDSHRILGYGLTYYGYELTDASWVRIYFENDKLVKILHGNKPVEFKD